MSVQRFAEMLRQKMRLVTLKGDCARVVLFSIDLEETLKQYEAGQ